MATPCARCGYNLDGLNPSPGAIVCPECAHPHSGAAPTAHWLYRRRWLVAMGWCMCAAIAWGILTARTANGWGQMGLVVYLSAAPGVLAGVIASFTTVIGGRVLTPLGIRQAMNIRWRTLLIDALLVALGSAAAGVVACYISGGISMTVWGGYGC